MRGEVEEMLGYFCVDILIMVVLIFQFLLGSLPCDRTLQDYTHFINAGVGVQTEVMKQLIYEAIIGTLQD